ncbi:MAG: hypothetical protein V2A66_01050 [Pseudomonadota bacterium]
MKKFLLVVLLLAAAYYVANQRVALQTGHTKDGKTNVVLVDKASGKVFRLMGK